MAVQIFALPTLLFINNGKVLKRIEGHCQNEFTDSQLVLTLATSRRSIDGKQAAVDL
jgi:hypothetical protein